VHGLLPRGRQVRYHRGMIRVRLLASLGASFVLLIGCGGNKNGGNGDDDDGPDACVGLECQVVDCSAMSLPPTAITGKVFAPNGTLPLNGVSVYIPRDLPLPPFTEGVACERCSADLPGSPIVTAVSDAAGNFRLDNVPAGADVPLVITTGKWRRIVTIPSVAQCTDNALGVADTRLPANRTEGEIPRIAITTGNADTLECLVRKLGVSDSEIGKTGDDRRIHLYSGNGTASFDGGFGGGSGAIPDANPFWNNLDNLKAYDIVILSCEGQQNANSPAKAAKPQSALDAMKAYADIGGRVFASHWHNIWISGHFQGTGSGQTPAVWNELGTWNNGQNFNNTIIDVIDEVNNPKGTQFADWMVNVDGSPQTRGELPVTQARTTNVTLDQTRVERWVFTKGGDGPPAGRAQMFQFTTPIEITPDQRCGKVVFTDMHVSGSPANINPYPTHCVGGNNLTPQEKALAFMFFDIASCVGGLF
jgi:hypothetical protein